jgi:hypothetical protein
MEKLALLASIGVADVIGTAAAADDQGSAILIRSCEIFMTYLLKFIYSEKAAKFCEIFPLLLTTVHPVKPLLPAHFHNLFLMVGVLPPCRQVFTTVRHQISMDFDYSSLQIADVFYRRPFTLIPERILRSCYSQSPKRIDLCATCYGNAICS